MKKPLIVLLLVFNILYTIPGRGSRDDALYDDIVKYEDSTLYVTISRRKHRIGNRYLSNIAKASLYENNNRTGKVIHGKYLIELQMVWMNYLVSVYNVDTL
jgi:hypothetical protein